MSAHLHSTHAVDTLINAAAVLQERDLLGQAYSPLFPNDAPFTTLRDVPPELARRDVSRLTAIAQFLEDFRTGLTATAGSLARYIEATEEDIRELALGYAKYHLPGYQKLAWTERLLRSPVPGDNVTSKMARVNDARFWRRAIRVFLMRERERFFLRLRLVGNGGEAYVSDAQVKTRGQQLRSQEKWMKDTVLIPRYLDPETLEKGAMTLESVATSPAQHFAKLYTFVKAMDVLADENGLATGMLTLTLEPKWHPNPSRGANSWNGSTPREAHRSMGKRWQSILRDLDRAGVGVSGLRVAEPHKDGCPHWHLWLLYRPDVEVTILETVMKYFPNKLKVRAPSRKGENTTGADRIYETIVDLRAGAGRSPRRAKEGAQVELSRIDRSISSGASYAMKYLLKTVDGGTPSAKPKQQTETLPESEPVIDKKKAKALRRAKRKHVVATRRVDAYRSLWGINAGQLFGVAKCLTAWDELRRLQDPPSHPLLAKLWALARGTDKPGRIRAGAELRGDAKAFIETLGGLAACGKPAKNAVRLSVGRLVEEATNGYGEKIVRTKGVTLVERRQVKTVVGERIHKRTGEVTAKTAWRSVKTIIVSVKTRLQEWMLVPKKHEKTALQQAVRRLQTEAFG